MKLRALVPEPLADYLSLLRARARYPGRRIDSHRIARTAKLGREVYIARDVELGNFVEVGDYSYLNAATAVGTARIGRFCSIGYGCQIGPPNHPIHHISTSPWTYGQENLFDRPATFDPYASPARIGSDVWIGSLSVVLQGVEVGHGAVIAAGSVVTKNVAPYAIVAGVPAETKKMRFGEDEIAYLESLRWWDLPTGELKALRDMFGAGDRWFERVPESARAKKRRASNV